MAEKIDLTVPYEPDPRSASSFGISRLEFNWLQRIIVIELYDAQTGISRSFSYDGQEAQTLMVALNKANLTTKSLHRRVIEKLVADAKIDGTITGDPD